MHYNWFVSRYVARGILSSNNPAIRLYFKTYLGIYTYGDIGGDWFSFALVYFVFIIWFFYVNLVKVWILYFFLLLSLC